MEELASVLVSRPTDVRELLQYALALLIVEDGRASITGISCSKAHHAQVGAA
jgi:hypothetical protein